MSHLADASTPQRGSGALVAAAGGLRVHPGMASGVGKTYAMLGAGARRTACGGDVVAGTVETHGRPATAAELGGLDAVHVHPSEALGPPRTAALQPIRQLTEESSGTWIEIEDDDPARALMRAAIEHRATHIVLGPSRRSRWLHLLAGGSAVRRLTRLAGDAGIDVHIIARPTISTAGVPQPDDARSKGSAVPTSAPDQGESAATIWWQDDWWKI